SLEPSAGIDRGAERLLRLTTFLAAAFRGFEARVDATGRVDEHGFRAWPLDFDLLSRLAGLDRIDVVATEQLLATGFHERVHESLPGIEEERVEEQAAAPVLHVPGAQTDRHWSVCRDREEELAAVARLVKHARRQSGDRAELDRTAVVFQRPLPYLYLAAQVFPDAGLPYQAVDSLPLAAEPFAAAIDL